MNKHKKIYLLAIFIGVLCAAFFTYSSLKPYNKLLSARSQDKVAENVFPTPDSTSYNMGLYLDINTSTLYGSTSLKTVNTTAVPLKELWFTVYPNTFKDANHSPAPASAYYSGFDPGWLIIKQLKVNGYEVKYSEPGAVSLKADLRQDLAPGSEITIELQWQARIPRVAYRYGMNKRVYMLGDFYPVLNVFSAEGWHKAYNSKFGDPFCLSCADYLVRVNIPEDYGMVSTGVNMETIAEDNGRQTCVIKAENARDFCLVVMYDYTQEKASLNKIDIKCYTPAAYNDKVQPYLAESKQVMDYFSCLYGSYPYQDFKVVFVPMKGFNGMEYSGLIFLSDELLQPGYDQNKSQLVLAHEIAHQWWYGLVGNDQLREPWLDEGLANWSAYKYLQAQQGKIPPGVIQFPQGTNLVRGLDNISSNREYYLIAYTGGQEFWFDLENILGTETVVKILRQYLAEYKYGIATASSIKDIIESEAHRNMQDYFTKWLK